MTITAEKSIIDAPELKDIIMAIDLDKDILCVMLSRKEKDGSITVLGNLTVGVND